MNEIELHLKVCQLRELYADTQKLKEAEEEKLEQAQEQLNDLLQAQEIAQEAATQIQQLVHKQISDIVNKCLQTIFDDLYEFKIRFTPKRGKTEAEFLFIKDGKEIKDIGGGVIDVVAFALQLSSLLLSRKDLRPVLALDQPFSNVSKAKGYLERVPEMMIMLAEEFGIQFVQVTHEDLLKIGKVIELE